MPWMSGQVAKRAVPVAFAVALGCTTSAVAASSVEFVPSKDASRSDAQTIAKAAAIAKTVTASACFGDFISNRKLVHTNGRSPRDVAHQLESLSGKITVAFYYRCMRGSPACTEPTIAIAYRQPPDKTIYLNSAWYNPERPGFDIYEMAGSMAHEALGHSLGGYEHPFDWTRERDFTVPYSISGASKRNGDAFQYCRAPLGYSSPTQ